MKKILFALLAIVLVVVIGIAALLALVDPNQFKPMIAEQVKKATGRELVMDGDISWRFFPSVGLDIGKTEFRNPAGFAEENLMRFDRAELSVSVLPLLSNQLEIGNVSLHGGRVFIQTLKSGKSNLDGLGQAKDESGADTSAQDTAKDTANEPKQAWALSLEGIEIVDASAVIRDDKAGTLTQVDKLDFVLNRFAPGEWTAASFDVTGKNGELNFQAKGNTELMIAKAMDTAELKKLSLQAAVNDPKNDIRGFTLAMDQFKLGEWSAIEFAVEGQIPDLTFDAKGSTRLKMDPALTVVDVQALDMKADLKGAVLPRPEMKVALKTDATYQLKEQKATLSNLAADIDELSLTGKGSFKSANVPVIRIDLASDNIDLDAFLGTEKSAQEQAATPAEGGQKPQAPAAAKDKDAEPDLSALKTVDLAANVAIGKFKAANAKLSDVLLKLTIKNGVLNMSSLDAKLYQGSIHATAKLDANGKLPTYRVNKQIKGVQVHPLLMDVTQNDVLAGTGDISVNLSGTGLSENRIRQNVAGTLAINFADGAIYGVNIPEMIREARATLKGKKADYVEEERKTDFSAMKATFKVGNGVASTDNIDVDSPLLRVDGKGSTNLMSEELNFLINTSLVATSKGQGGKDIDEVANLTVPIDVKGNWTEPKFGLNLAMLLKQNNELEKKAKKEVERGLEKLLGDKAKDEGVKDVADKLLKGLFN